MGEKTTSRGSTWRVSWLLLAVLAGLVATLTAAAPAAAGTFTCDGRPATHVLSNGNDNFSSGLGNQVVVGRDGRDSISTGPGRDRVCAGFGNDLVDGEQDSDPFLSGGPNRDEVHGTTGRDHLEGGSEDDCGQNPRCPPAAFQGMGIIYPGLLGGGGNDFIDGGDGRDDLLGNSGDDDLFGGFGVDYLDGGSGGETTGDDCDTGPGVDLSPVNCE